MKMNKLVKIALTIGAISAVSGDITPKSWAAETSKPVKEGEAMKCGAGKCGEKMKEKMECKSDDKECKAEHAKKMGEAKGHMKDKAKGKAKGHAGKKGKSGGCGAGSCG